MAALDNEIKKRFPTLAPTRWTYSNRLFQTVYEHKQQIEDLLTSIVENSDSWDPETVCSARGLLSTVHDFDFNFFLNVFYSIFPQADILFQVLQKIAFDIEFCSKQVEKFSSHLTKLREDFESIWNKVSYNSVKPAPSKRLRIDAISGESRSMSYKRIFLEVIDVIKTNIEYRFADLSKLKFLSILDSRYFKEFAKQFSEEGFLSLKQSYGKFFDF
ncbi:hypothetical protein ANN_19143 [Periplaneta americana]|uniref:Uncharacterized protein n=1 Tax=Periplaneta americana TaxID=6978 RepID=A0ABQ8S993_PERAM|nr:hypothetical protein ANN_19143 [Periplaneta americana]